MKNKIKTPLDLAKAIEEVNGDAVWRHVFVVPAELSKTKKKEYHFEKPSLTSEEIGGDGYLSASGKFRFPGRGWKDVKDMPSFMQKSGDTNWSQVYRGISIYLKYVPDLFVIDFDEGNHDATNPFFQFCMDKETIFIETKKGFHFYFWVPGVPEFSCSTAIQSDEDFGDVDILGRKYKNSFNVIEADHHEVQNGLAGIEGIKSVPWDTLSEFLNVDRMLGRDKKNDKQTKKEKNETKAICSDGVELSADKFRGYLARLRKEDHRTISEKKSRWHYEDFMKIGMICKNNFDDNEVGFDIWRTWVREDPLIADDSGKGHSHRTAQYLLEKWSSFDEVANPLTWKTLRSMASDDDPTKNTYQEVFDLSGLEGMVEYMNGFLMMNVNTGEILYENPNETKSYDVMPNFYTPDKARPVFDKYTIAVEDEKGKVKFKNPFSLWIKHIGCRHVNRIVFDPTPSAPTDVYNLFGGFEISKLDVAEITEREAKETCANLINHIYHIWCHRNQEHFDYVMNWFAFVLQRPWIKIGILLAVKSREGGGKGIVFDFMRHILGGRLYAQINSLDQLIGTHNSVLEGRLLINGDEIIWGGNIKDGNSMKSVITETEVWIHEKYRARYKVQNTSAICISSNEDRSLSAREGDRRSYGLELSNQWAGRQKTAEHKAYFCDISGTNHHGIARDKAEAFAKLLYERDLGNFVPQNAPITEMLTDNMERNWNPLQKFWKDVLNNGAFTIEDKFKRATRETYIDNHPEFGSQEKQRWVDYDETQLLWGNVGEDWGNGYKVSQVDWEDTTKPFIAYAFVPHYGGGNHNDGKTMERWSKLLQSEPVQALGLELTKEECEAIPMHKCFLNILKQRQTYSNSDDVLDWKEDNHPWLDEQLTGFVWSKGKGWKGGVYLHLDNPSDDYEDYHPWGLRKEHLQNGEPFRLMKEHNWDGSVEKSWEFGASSYKDTISWHFDDVPNLFDEISQMGKREHKHSSPEVSLKAGGSLVGDKKMTEFSHLPIHFLRDTGETFFIDKEHEETGGYNQQKFMTFCRKYSKLEIIDVDGFTSYIQKWRGGVNAENHKEDLISKEWFDEKGKLYFQKKSEKITRWVYDRDWVYNRYKESVGIGYGQDNLDKGAFWKGICELQGGRSSEGNGGVYKTMKLTDGAKGSQDRKAYWKFVNLDKNREMFQKWTGRIVKWDDEEVEEEFPEDWY